MEGSSPSAVSLNPGYPRITQTSPWGAGVVLQSGRSIWVLSMLGTFNVVEMSEQTDPGDARGDAFKSCFKLVHSFNVWFSINVVLCHLNRCFCLFRWGERSLAGEKRG